MCPLYSINSEHIIFPCKLNGSGLFIDLISRRQKFRERTNKFHMRMSGPGRNPTAHAHFTSYETPIVFYVRVR